MYLLYQEISVAARGEKGLSCVFICDILSNDLFKCLDYVSALFDAFGVVFLVCLNVVARWMYKKSSCFRGVRLWL